MMRPIRVSDDDVGLDHRLASAEAMLREIATSGVEVNDERIDWVTVQIDRTTWEDLQRWQEAHP